MRTAGAALLLLLVVSLCARAGAQPECQPEAGLAYVCGLQRPEDVLVIPGTRWLIVSGFAPGAGLHLIDTRRRTALPAYRRLPAEVDPDPAGGALCSGPVDPALFNARGLSLRGISAGRFELLVVNHGGRESIERFELRLEQDAPQLRWRGCLPMPAGQVGNAVAAFVDGTVLVTVLTRPGTAIADFVEGRNTGAVWQWQPEANSFQQLPGTELPGNNGIEADPDGRHFYVVAFGWHAVAVFDRNRSEGPLEVITAPDFMPDNIHWSSGRLLLAGMRYDEPACGGTRKIVDGIADPMLCHRGWVVGELDLQHHRISAVAQGGPVQDFNGVSAAARMDGELWLGSFQSDRIAVAVSPEPLRDGALPRR
jgi:hypothetical protein